MVSSSFRFYFFSLLIILNVFTCVGETVLMDFEIFLILRSFIIIASAIIFKITIVFMIRASLENLEEVKTTVRIIKLLEYGIVVLGSGVLIYLFIKNAIE